MKIILTRVQNGVQLAIEAAGKEASLLDDCVKFTFECSSMNRGVERYHDEAQPGWLTYMIPGPFAPDRALGLITRLTQELEMERRIASLRKTTEVLGDAGSVSAVELILDTVPVADLQALGEQLSTGPDQTYALGEFNLTQPELLISDPCYEPGTWCSGSVSAKPGRWLAEVTIGPTSWMRRTKALRVRHESTSADIYAEPFEDSGIDVGVDSGQCGVFDAAKYEQDAYCEKAYERICNITLNHPLAGGVLAEASGAVTQSGFGDGSYAARIRKDETGRIVAVQVIFISDEELDLEDEDENTDPDEQEQSETAEQ